MAKSDARLFAEHISATLGEHDSIRVVPATRDGLPPVCCFIFRDRPANGLMTAISYGLSLGHNPKWENEQPELIACVRSDDEEWGLALAGFAERLRGEHSFEDGSILMGPTPLAAESEMGGFLLSEQSIVAPDAANISIGGRSIRLREAIPIYECEMEFIHEIGPVEFLVRLRRADFRDVQREHIWR